MRQKLGFTVTELLVACSIGLVALLAATELYRLSYSSYLKFTVVTSLGRDSKLLANHLSRRIQQVGGGAVRPWAAIWIEDNCGPRAGMPACGGADRINLASLQSQFAECEITGMASANVVKVNSAPACCLTPAHLSQQVVVTRADKFASYFISGVDLGTCRATLSGGQLSANDFKDAVPDWTTGSLSVVKTQTYFLDPATSQLFLFTDVNGNGQMDPGEGTLAAYDVGDLQVSLGYDFAPADGRISDVEWMYQSAATTAAIGTGVFATANRADLRMVELRTLVVYPRTVTNLNGERSATLSNGPLRVFPTQMFEQSSNRLALRNVNILE